MDFDIHFHLGAPMPDSDSGTRSFTAFLTRAGLKSTRQRERIVRAFFAAGRHISAEELYHQIRAQDPSIGLVTVYRTLKLLRQAGLATERKFGDTYARFDPNPADWTHHHLICTRCGKIQEFQDATLRALGAKVAHSQGFSVTEQRLELYGVCRDCARLEGRRTTGGPRAVPGQARPRSAS
jgi:Fur family ferric uptake transcriptional regulator